MGVGWGGGYNGALDGGSPMSPVDFKKWQCLLSLSFKCPCRFLKILMSLVTNSEKSLSILR